jgi:hypothetical protein
MICVSPKLHFTISPSPSLGFVYRRRCGDGISCGISCTTTSKKNSFRDNNGGSRSVVEVRDGLQHQNQQNTHICAFAGWSKNNLAIIRLSNVFTTPKNVPGTQRSTSSEATDAAGATGARVVGAGSRPRDLVVQAD